MQFAAHTTDDADRLAKVDLGMSRRVMKRYELLRSPMPRFANIVGNDRITAIVAMLVPDPLEDPFGRVPLLLRRLAIALQVSVG
jgi:hypothetical protein